MSIPVTKAQIDAALGEPSAAVSLFDDLRRSIQDPSVVYPEMYGAPEVARSGLADFDPSTTSAADTTALQQCMTALAQHGGTLLLRRPYGLTAGLTLDITKEGVRDGQRIIGTNGPYGCGLQMLSNGFNALTLRGLDPSGNVRHPAHPSQIESFFIKGGSGTGKGIFTQNALSANYTDVSNMLISRMYISTGEEAVHIAQGFQLGLHLVKAGSAKRHAFSLQGGNTTKLELCYAMSAGDGYAGYRVIAGSPVAMYACTGLDENACSWAALGSMANISGTTRSGSSTTMVKLGSAHTEPTGFFDMCQIKITSGALDGAEARISRYVGGADPTAYLSVHTPLASAPASGVTYNLSDGDSRWSNAGTPYAKDARITMQDCNVESCARTGIKTYRAGLLTLQNLLFFIDADVAPTHDCCIYLNEHVTNYSVKLQASRFDVSASNRNPGYPAELLQGKGSTPMMMCERIASEFRTIRSMETGADMRMMHVDPFGITLPTGFPTSNPGAGRLWSNGGVLTVGT